MLRSLLIGLLTISFLVPVWAQDLHFREVRDTPKVAFGTARPPLQKEAQNFKVHASTGIIGNRQRTVVVLGEEHRAPERSKVKEHLIRVSSLGVDFDLLQIGSYLPQKDASLSAEAKAGILKGLAQEGATLTRREQEQVEIDVRHQPVTRLSDLTDEAEHPVIPLVPQSRWEKVGRVIWNSVRAVDAASGVYGICHIGVSLVAGDFATAGMGAGIFAAGSGARKGFTDFFWPWFKARCPYVDRLTERTQTYLKIKDKVTNIGDNTIKAFEVDPDLEMLIIVVDEAQAQNVLNDLEQRHGLERLPLEAQISTDHV